MSGEPKKILLVDDDRSIRILYTDVFEDAGFEVTEVATAAEALDRLVNGEVFDLLVTDIMMAKMDGWELLQTVRDGLKFDSKTLPVIVVSAHFDSAVLDMEALKRGANATYAKTQPLSKLVREAKIHARTLRSKYDNDTDPGYRVNRS